MHFTGILYLAGLAAALPQRPGRITTAVAKVRAAQVTTTPAAPRSPAQTSTTTPVKAVTAAAAATSATQLRDLSLPFVTQPAFIQAMLDAHNTMRSFHVNTNNLTWSNDLAQAAKRQLDTHVFQHTSNNPYGENLAYTSDSQANPRYMVQLWYNEVSLYDYNNPGFSGQTGHFTQLVWRDTTAVGCAWDRGYDQFPSTYRFLTCEYAPYGNIVSPGYFETQVTKPTGTPPMQPSKL